MIVTPAPVSLLIVVFELGKIAIFAMVLFCIHTIRLIFMTIPFMIVIVLFVVISDRLVILVILVVLGAQRHGGHCERY